ncbi:MAG: hypothetical protein HKN04_06965, partial [Rhodothermaceae bacterium]|nr:hypothetical protein [Rhodothermaceae bacterium]
PPTPRPKRPWTILGRLAQAVREQNWFAVLLELAIVVLGVVIGFQVTAWGQARSDRVQERTYLRQLAADLAETERDIGRASATIAPWDRAAAQLLQAFRTPGRPPMDSVYAWLGSAVRVNRVRPVDGTAQALIATGDLSLIRSDSLRSSITAYLNGNRHQIASTDLQMEAHFEAVRTLSRHIDRLEAEPAVADSAVVAIMREAFPHTYVPDGPVRTPFPTTSEAFFQNREAYTEVQELTRMKWLMAGNRLFMIQRTRALREQVEAELNR